MVTQLQYPTVNPLLPSGLFYPCKSGCGSSVGCVSAWCADSRGFDPHVWQHSFVEIGHEIISTAILSADSGSAVVSYWQKNVH